MVRLKGGISMLFEDKEQKKKINFESTIMAEIEPEDCKKRRKVVVGGLSLLFKDENHHRQQCPEKKDCTEENIAVVIEEFSLVSKDEDSEEQKEVINCEESMKPVEKMKNNWSTIRTNNKNDNNNYTFKMPLHFPKYTKKDYEEMSEKGLDMLLQDYGLFVNGDLSYKKQFAISAFLWPPTEVIDQNFLEEKKDISITSIVEYLRYALGFA